MYLLIAGSIYRWSNSGKVCSGSFVTDFTPEGAQGYLWSSGRFLNIILILNYVGIGAACCCICCIAVVGLGAAGTIAGLKASEPQMMGK